MHLALTSLLQFRPDFVLYLVVSQIPCLFGKLIRELQGQQRGMPFVHVEALDVGVTQGAQHPDPAYSQHDLLANPVVLVAAVEMIGDGTILRGILFKIRIQKIDRHDIAADTPDFIFPRAYLNLPPFDFDRTTRLHFLQQLGYRPDDILFALPAGGVQLLAEIAFAVEQRHHDHGDTHIGRRAHRVSGEYAQAARIGRHGLGETDLHGEIGDVVFAVHVSSYGNPEDQFADRRFAIWATCLP